MKLRKKFPLLKIIIDYRDRLEHCFDLLSSKQREFEKMVQLEILRNVDGVITVNEGILKHISALNPKLKVSTLPHCVDDDFYDLSKRIFKKEKYEKINFIYGGALAGKMDPEIKLFVDFFKLFENKSKINCYADFYLYSMAYEDIFSNSSNIRISPILERNEFIAKLVDSDFVLIFRPEWSLDVLSSKFFELVALRKPILYFGKDGIVSEFLAKNKLGFHITRENIDSVIDEMIDNLKIQIIPDRNYDISSHTFEYQTKKLIEIISEI
jgi:hypothetical protein